MDPLLTGYLYSQLGVCVWGGHDGVWDVASPLSDPDQTFSLCNVGGGFTRSARGNIFLCAGGFSGSTRGKIFSSRCGFFRVNQGEHFFLRVRAGFHQVSKGEIILDLVQAVT